MGRNSETNFNVPEMVKGQYNYSYSILENLEETISYGENFIKNIPTIKLILLQGPLGAGKTSLVKGIAKGLGIKEPITSPTFSLSQHYRGQRLLVHLDLYRLEDPLIANEFFIEEEEEVINQKGIMIVEWPERLGIKLQEAWLAKIKYTEDNKRLIQLFPPRSEEINLITCS